MKRDGHTVSLWQDTAPDFPQQKMIDDALFDVIIAGGGMTGLATAMLLQEQGLRCLICEAHTLGFGTTGGTTAHLNTFLDTPYHTIEKDFGHRGAETVHRAARAALDLVKKNVEQYGIDCGWAERDAQVYAQDSGQEQELTDHYAVAKNIGVEVSKLDGELCVPFDYRKALVFHRQAQFHPTRYILGLAAAFEKRGGTILQNCAVDKVEQEDTVAVQTTKGAFRSRYFIWATHIPPGINVMHFRNAPYRSYAVAVTLKNDKYPECLAYDMYDPYHYYRTQEVDGKKYLIAGGEDHKTAEEPDTDGRFRALEAFVRQHFQVDEVAYKWSSQYYEPADGIAYIGHLPGSGKHVLVATGYGGNGMTYSHIAAQTLADIVLDRKTDAVELFSPGRVKPIAGFAAFVQENADVVAQFVGRLFSKDKLESLIELAPGEAKVVKYEGESLALYKNEQGELFALNPVCTHAKCTVGWNSAERTWDCPCHGARYSITGEVLTGPARKPLEVISLSELAGKV